MELPPESELTEPIRPSNSPYAVVGSMAAAAERLGYAMGDADSAYRELVLQLLTLALDQNQFTDASSLALLQQLQGLSVARNQLVNVAPLGALSGLLALDISHNGTTTGIPALRALTHASAIRSEGNGGVRCIDYATLVLTLGPVVIFDKCRLF